MIIAAIWVFCLYTLYRIQLFTELNARQSFLRLKDQREKLQTSEKEKTLLIEDVKQLEAANKKIRQEVEVSGLNERQVELVRENSGYLEDEVDPKFKLDWRDLKFTRLLGSGSFGDCYHGLLGEQEVAVS